MADTKLSEQAYLAEIERLQARVAELEEAPRFWNQQQTAALDHALAELEALQARDAILVKALAGIADPAAFVERAKASEVLLRTVYKRDLARNWDADEIAALAAEWTQDEQA